MAVPVVDMLTPAIPRFLTERHKLEHRKRVLITARKEVAKTGDQESRGQLNQTPPCLRQQYPLGNNSPEVRRY
jgi:hypothetical protein